MKKKIGLLVAAGLLVMGTVSAASLWGTYKGNEIIRITVNGAETKVTDVPAITYQGRTMVPVYLLKSAGLDYAWDDKTKTVNIIKQDNFMNKMKVDQLSKLSDLKTIYWNGFFIVSKMNDFASQYSLNNKNNITKDNIDSMVNDFLNKLNYYGLNEFRLLPDQRTKLATTLTETKKLLFEYADNKDSSKLDAYAKRQTDLNNILTEFGQTVYSTYTTLENDLKTNLK